VALEYELELSTNMGRTQALEMLARQVDGLEWDEDSSLLFGSTITVHTSESDRLSRKVIERGFHFEPTLSVVFRFVSNTDFNSFKQIMLRATMLLLEQAQDAVLLFNYEIIVLQRLGGQLTFNADHHLWDDDWLKGRLTVPFERRPLPSPLL
jgi:hypothetical protein